MYISFNSVLVYWSGDDEDGAKYFRVLSTHKNSHGREILLCNVVTSAFNAEWNVHLPGVDVPNLVRIDTKEMGITFLGGIGAREQFMGRRRVDWKYQKTIYWPFEYK